MTQKEKITFKDGFKAGFGFYLGQFAAGATIAAGVFVVITICAIVAAVYQQ